MNYTRWLSEKELKERTDSSYWAGVMSASLFWLFVILSFVFTLPYFLY